MSKHDESVMDELEVADHKVVVVVYRPETPDKKFDVRLLEGIAAATWLAFDGHPYADDAIYDAGYLSYHLSAEVCDINEFNKFVPVLQELGKGLQQLGDPDWKEKS